jgi:hypothetical protein
MHDVVHLPILWDLEYMTWFDFLLSISYSQLGLSSASRFTVYGTRSISTLGSVFCIIRHGGAIFDGVRLVNGWIWGYVVGWSWGYASLLNHQVNVMNVGYGAQFSLPRMISHMTDCIFASQKDNT